MMMMMTMMPRFGCRLRLATVLAISALLAFLLFFLRDFLLDNPRYRRAHSAVNEKDENIFVMYRDRANPIAGVIYFMLGSHASLETGGVRLLHQLAERLPVQYPVKVFFDDAALADELDALKRQFEGLLDVEPVQLEFEVPPFVEEEQVKECPAGFTGKLGTVGYRHMCRFYSGEVFRHPVLQEYDYAWRLDPDSVLDCPLKDDPFEVMRRNDYKYGYWMYFFDESILTGDTLWKSVMSYIEDTGITPKSGFNKLTTTLAFPERRTFHGCHYWNNSEMMYLKFFRSRRYLDFFDYLDNTGGFYEFRWGDALVRTMGVSLFLEENEIHRFTDIPYSHGGYRNTADCPNYNQSDTVCPGGQCPFCSYWERNFRGINVENVLFIINAVLGVAMATLLIEGCCIALCMRLRRHPGRLEIGHFRSRSVPKMSTS